MAGYSCMYTQFVTATVTITGNMTDFENDVGGIKSRFIQAVALAAGGVPVGNVNILNITALHTPSHSGRRLMAAEGRAVEPAGFTVEVRVDHASHLHNLEKHLLVHVGDALARGRWSTGKDIRVVRRGSSL